MSGSFASSPGVAFVAVDVVVAAGEPRYRIGWPFPLLACGLLRTRACLPQKKRRSRARRHMRRACVGLERGSSLGRVNLTERTKENAVVKRKVGVHTRTILNDLLSRNVGTCELRA